MIAGLVCCDWELVCQCCIDALFVCQLRMRCFTGQDPQRAYLGLGGPPHMDPLAGYRHLAMYPPGSRERCVCLHVAGLRATQAHPHLHTCTDIHMHTPTWVYTAMHIHTNVIHAHGYAFHCLLKFSFLWSIWSNTKRRNSRQLII